MRATADTRIIVESATDHGRRRERNEDAHGSSIPADPLTLARKGILLVVADGMGGIGRGDIASRIAVETVLERYRANDSGSPLDDLRGALERANQEIHDEKSRDAELGAMGATCTAAVIQDGVVVLAHVGDSRAYLVRSKVAKQLTKDHTLVAQLVRENRLDPKAARSDPRRHMVTRGLGVEPSVHVDTSQMEGILEPDDSLVLCTDGLHGLVADGEIGRVAGQSDPLKACRDLISLANDHGGSDNITVVLARVVGKTAAPTGPGRRIGLLLVCVLVGAAVLIVLLSHLPSLKRILEATSR